MTVTHHLSLDVQIEGGKNWLEVWNELNNLAQSFGKYQANIAVTSTLLEEPTNEFLENYNMTVENAAFEAREKLDKFDPTGVVNTERVHTPMSKNEVVAKLAQETYNEDTLYKVFEAIAATTPLNTRKIHDAIEAMQNAGILFRERAR